MNVTRNGKIARLPRAVRQELNRRLDEGEQGKKLVAWLNAHGRRDVQIDKEPTSACPLRCRIWSRSWSMSH